MLKRWISGGLPYVTSVLGLLGGWWLSLPASLPVAAQVATGTSTKITTVGRVLSGDTVMLQDGTVVRLIGILAPTSGPAAEQARERVRQLILGKTVEVWLENQNLDLGHRDKYGRQLSYIYLLPSRKLLNAEILRDGDAYYFSQHFIDVRTKNILLAAEYQARKARLGVWAQATESPEAIAKREGRVYEEPAFTPPAEEESPNDGARSGATGMTSMGSEVSDGAMGQPSSGMPRPTSAPELNTKATYSNIRVESCAVLDVPTLGPVALIGVQNSTAKAGEVARLETVKLVQGKRLRFEYDPANAARDHRDRDGRLLVYAFLPDGALLNLQIVARGIADVDIDYDYKYKSEMLTARDNARVRELGPRWRNDIPRTVSLDRIRAEMIRLMNEQFGRAGARIEVVGDERDVLRISHDLIDQPTAEQLYRALSVSEGGNLPLLRSSGIREVQFTDAKATKIFRFPL
ncbi:thermonuclease family protein [Chloracidobacterium thermophilum]|uniref:thermonuclease family protein n=1 Tax=Chloracidobacterium thermophilum TaxID=458033 RepID=UPI000739870B|nr:thermonuclease family protein [Chloracidobacterium thermophilum]